MHKECIIKDRSLILGRGGGATNHDGWGSQVWPPTNI